MLRVGDVDVLMVMFGDGDVGEVFAMVVFGEGYVLIVMFADGDVW